MDHTPNADTVTIPRGEKEVFRRIRKAQEQYERYLAIADAATVTLPPDPPAVPPPTDLPLSLAIWRTRFPRTSDDKVRVSAKPNPVNGQSRPIAK